MRGTRGERVRGFAALFAVALVVCASAASVAAAANDKPQRYRFELTEFKGQSDINTAHSIPPCTPDVEAVFDGTLTGSFVASTDARATIKIAKSTASGRITASADPVLYDQDGVRIGDTEPCGSEESAPFELPCSRAVATTPGITGFVTDATKKELEVSWRPTFDGVEYRYSPDFLCIQRLGPIAMPTSGFSGDTCSEHRYPRKQFERADVIELEISCTTNGFIPVAAGGTIGTFAGNYRAFLTLEAVAEKD